MNNKKNILITGATGFCGQNITTFFKENTNYIIFTTSRKTAGGKHNIKCNLSKISNLKKLPKKIDYIINCAAEVNEKEQDFKIIENNLMIAYNLSQYIHQIKPKCVINLSSISVYGYPNAKKITEKFPIGTNNYYGQSKIINEILFQNESNANTRILNLRLGYVLASKIPNRYFISKLIKLLKRNKNITLFDPKKNFFNFIDVNDVSKICSLLINSKISGTFNIVTDKQPTLYNIISDLQKFFPKNNSKIITVKNTMINQCTISNQKIKKTIKFKFTPYEKFFSRVINNMN